MLCRVPPREQGRAARRAHRRVGVGAVEGESGRRELVLVRGQVSQPARDVGPVTRVALLVGDQQQQVRGSHPDFFGRFAFAPLFLVAIRSSALTAPSIVAARVPPTSAITCSRGIFSPRAASRTVSTY